MSLTSHLKDADSPVRRFIHANAPQLALAGTRGRGGVEWAAKFGFDELTALETQIPIPTEVPPSRRSSHAGLAGMALDYRIRMDLPTFDISTTTARKGLDRLANNPEIVHRGKHIHRLLGQATMGLAYLTLREPSPHPLSLARASVSLAWCESIYRAGPVGALTADLGRQIKRAKDAGELLLGIDDYLLLDIVRMHAPIRDLLVEWSRDISEGTEYEPNPTFLGGFAVGGADGDFVVGDLLIDVKTREEVTNPWLRNCLLQLLGYVLLDLDDAQGIRRVGIMLPRQAHLQIWWVDELLGQDAAQVLPSLRADMADLLCAILE